MRNAFFWAALMAAAFSPTAAASVAVSCPVDSIEAYRGLARFAVSLGATHLDACQIEPSLWQWDADRADPYPNWSMYRATVFKFIVPEQLKAYLPQNYARRNLETLRARAAVLKEFGLKSYFSGMEPAYLPERAYLDHPEWRGPRCDQCRRARKEYYAPCVDNADMRKMYVDAVAELCRTCPFDRFEIRSNDSGSAICWSDWLYPGRNGPAACEGKPFARRVVDFLSIFQEGAALAGLPDAKVNVRANLTGPGHELEVLPHLKPGQSVNGQTADASAVTSVIGFPNRFLDSTVPVHGLARMAFIARQIQDAQANPGRDIVIGLRALDEDDTRLLLEMHLHKTIGPGPAARGRALEATAARFVGEGAAPALAEAWQDVEDAVQRMEPFYSGGHLFTLAAVHQRWLVRPLVAFPGELEGEDRRYWRDYIFQAQTEEEAENLLDLQGHRWLHGYGAMRLITMATGKAEASALRAQRAFEALAGKAAGDAARRYLAEQARRTAFYVCMLRNARHVVEFQSILDRTDHSKPPRDTTLAIREQGDPRLQRINLIVRAEIENAHEMVRLLDSGSGPVVEQVKSPELQTVMAYGPQMRDDLLRKVRIMEAHRRDFLRLYRSRNY